VEIWKGYPNPTECGIRYIHISNDTAYIAHPLKLHGSHCALKGTEQATAYFRTSSDLMIGFSINRSITSNFCAIQNKINCPSIGLSAKRRGSFDKKSSAKGREKAPEVFRFSEEFSDLEQVVLLERTRAQRGKQRTHPITQCSSLP